MADQTKDRLSLLLEKLSDNSDTCLVFDGNKGKETVPAHASILRLHSAVLAEALNLAPSSKGAAATKEIQMPGTSKDEFLTLAQFMYPIVPLPKVSWDNLKVLLVEGHKWDMQVRGFVSASLKRIYVPCRVSPDVTVSSSASQNTPSQHRPQQH